MGHQSTPDACTTKTTGMIFGSNSLQPAYEIVRYTRLALWLLSTKNFADQSVGAVQLLYAFDDCRTVNSDSASALALVYIPVTIRKLLYVAVEIQTDELTVAIDD